MLAIARVLARDVKLLLLDEPYEGLAPVESIGLTSGFLIQALHRAGIATLTHTPEPMSFLTDICGRDKNNERPYMLLITDYPDEHATVPLHAPDKKSIDEIASFI